MEMDSLTRMMAYMALLTSPNYSIVKLACQQLGETVLSSRETHALSAARGLGGIQAKQKETLSFVCSDYLTNVVL